MKEGKRERKVRVKFAMMRLAGSASFINTFSPCTRKHDA